MKLFDQIQFPSSIQAIALGPEGDRIALVTGAGDPHPYSFTEPRRDQQLHLYRITAGRLNRETAFLISPPPEQQEDVARVRYRYKDLSTHLLFRDARTLLVARNVKHFHVDPAQQSNFGDVELIAVDVATGEVKGRYIEQNEPYVFGLALAPPNHVLLAIQKTVVCIEADALRKVCLARQIDELGDPMEEDAVPEETIASEGLAYDAARSLLYFLCSYFDAAVLLCYRFDEEKQSFTRVSRSRTFTSYDAAGLCLNPDGSGITASFQIMQRMLDLWGRPIAGLEQMEQARNAAREQQSRGAVPIPRTAQLGALAIFSDQGEKWIDLHSELERDFVWILESTVDADGRPLPYWYRVGIEADNPTMKPVYLDDRRLVVGTPSGFLQLVDVVSGEATLIYDLKSAINSLIFHPQHRLLLAGCEDGVLTAFSV